jgi:hypothetical protein
MQARTAKRDGRVRARKLIDLVRREIDDGATSVEEIHKAIANLPLDVLERLDVFEEMVKDVRKVQEARIGAIYDVIHKVNAEVAKLAREILRELPARKAIARKAAPRKATARRAVPARAAHARPA